MENGLHVFLAYEAGDIMDGEGNKVLEEIGSPLEIHQYTHPRVISREKGPLPILAKPEEQISTRKKVRGLRAWPHYLSAMVGKRGG